MARNPRTILDLSIDGADMATLYRINRRFRLGINHRWWWSGDRFRELVREGMRKRLSEASTPEAMRRLLDRW